ncbi:MAG TPA: hypothetical protein VIY90_16005 [Steroidobacteraceae bacterium]
MSILLLAIVLIGFARTLFLRPLFQVPAIPWYVYVHGSVMTVWIVLFVVQTSLVAARRTDLHRRLGVFGAVLAVSMVILAIVITLKIPSSFPTRAAAAAATGGPPITRQVAMQLAMQIMWGNVGTIILFPTLVATALRMRRRSDVHKRLMLLASMALVGPALGRMQAFPSLWGITASAPVITAFFTLLPIAADLLLPLTLVGHDLLTTRRLHQATLWGVLGYFTSAVGFFSVIPATAVGRALWNALE